MSDFKAKIHQIQFRQALCHLVRKCYTHTCLSCTECSLGEVSAASKASQRNMCTSHSTTQLSSCNDHVSVDSSGHQHSHTVDRSRCLSVCTVCEKSLINCNCKKFPMHTYNGKRSFCCNVCCKIVFVFHTFRTSHAYSTLVNSCKVVMCVVRSLDIQRV